MRSFYAPALRRSPHGAFGALKRPAIRCRFMQQQAAETPPDRIHILGTGSVGKFIAHTLRGGANPPPVTLLYHRPTLLDDFNAANGSISLTHTNGAVEERSGFDAELALPLRRDLGMPYEVGFNRKRFASLASNDPIYNVIVTTKAQQTVSALESIAHRLTPESTILFLQNGMGVIEEVNENVFPDPETRPNYLVGINSHGVHATSTCSVVHAGHGVMSISVVPRIPMAEQTQEKTLDPRPIYLLRAMIHKPLFAATPIPPTEFLETQLEKLVVNCIINPLTVMLDCRNGNLLANYSMTRVMRLLLAEILCVIHSLPELQDTPNLKTRFSPERMEKFVVNVARQTSENISSMLQDTRRGTKTEIEYINGYIVRRGEEAGIKPVMNYMLMHMVVGKEQLISREIDNFTPFV